MKRIEFESYGDYLKAQKLTIMRRGIGPYFCDLEMIRIAEWVRRNGLRVELGICHGARNGHECDELRRYLPQARIVGTDLFPHSGKSALTKTKSKVIEWDFNQVNPKWIGKFDLVYSNSLDHAIDPKAALQVWFDQLKFDGALFVQWNKSDLEAKGGDCFGANIVEYIDLLNSVGRVEDLIYVKTEWDKQNRLRRHGLECVVFVARRRINAS